ncbi:MAG: GNAT family protein [Thermoplasmata archaeon]|nr:GNAT family protein [Thermoplasmata archaeon]
MKKLLGKPVFKSLEDSDESEVHRRQNGECCSELFELFDNKPAWSPLTLAQIREKIGEKQKKQNSAIFSIYSGDDFIGLGEWSSSWDTWSPHSWFIIWPEHRRRGYGTEVAKMLLDRTFLENPGHEATAAVPEEDRGAAAFLGRIGFRPIGRMRRVDVSQGQYRDLLFFDILKSEYLQVSKGGRR